MEFDIELHVVRPAPDIEAANELYDKIFDILAEAGYEPEYGAVGPALESELLE
jgi:hypothetical protein